MNIDEKTQAACDKTAAETERLSAGLAPAFVGRTCPLKAALSLTGGAAPCDGPKCMLFMPYSSQGTAKIDSGACSIALGISQLPELIGSVQQTGKSLENLALAVGPRILGST